MNCEKFKKKILFTDSIDKSEIIIKSLGDFSMFSEEDLMKDIFKKEYFKDIKVKFNFDNEVIEYIFELNKEGKIYCNDILDGDITEYGFHLNKDLSYTYVQEKEAYTTLYKLALNGYYLCNKNSEENIEFEKYKLLDDMKKLKNYLTLTIGKNINSLILEQIIKSLHKDQLLYLALESDKDIGPFKISFTPVLESINEFNFEDYSDEICFYKKPEAPSNIFVLDILEESDKIRYFLFKKGLLLAT